MKYCSLVFGCQMNISDSERASAVLEELKYKKTQDTHEANLILVTMCSVRQSAVNRIHGLVEKFKTLKQRPTTILTGCVLKKDKKKFLQAFDYVIDIKDIKKLPQILGNDLNNDYNNDQNYLGLLPMHTSKFSAYVPIMTGCNNFCAYCAVPYARGREISRPAKDIITEVKTLIKNGYKEMWLLGQNVNSYHGLIRTNDPAINFAELLKMVNKIPGKFWIRFTSSHPKDFSSQVIGVMATCNKVTPYLNLPVQAGDDKVLKSMNRHYTISDYKNKIKELREKIPDICLSTDVIVGFAGETKKQFENTVELFKDIGYDMAYINKYSPRAGTAAAKLKDNVSIVEKKRREKILNTILKENALEKNKKYVGKKIEVLVDSKNGNVLSGRDKHYKHVQINSNKNLTGKFIFVKVIEAKPWSLKAEITN